MKICLHSVQGWLDRSRAADFLAPLALRLYLAPIMWMAGAKKWSAFNSTVEWFGNEDWGLGLPAPFLLAALVTATELFGAISLVLGLGVRWLAMPMFLTMIGAMLTVHGPNGWLAIAEPDGFFANERTMEAAARLAKAQEILQAYGNYDWLTEKGSFVILNNGVEFAATYAIMLLALFFHGAGRYVSVDYWLGVRLRGLA